ncbi:hypothetical protein Pelo_10599 [Pelomyxa schiedti]|nr:hypothetical protein Pelo_10599 [Pelomyxa schiedti]
MAAVAVVPPTMGHYIDLFSELCSRRGVPRAKLTEATTNGTSLARTAIALANLYLQHKCEKCMGNKKAKSHSHDSVEDVAVKLSQWEHVSDMYGLELALIVLYTRLVHESSKLPPSPVLIPRAENPALREPLLSRWTDANEKYCETWALQDKSLSFSSLNIRARTFASMVVPGMTNTVYISDARGCLTTLIFSAITTAHSRAVLDSLRFFIIDTDEGFLRFPRHFFPPSRVTVQRKPITDCPCTPQTLLFMNYAEPLLSTKRISDYLTKNCRNAVNRVMLAFPHEPSAHTLSELRVACPPHHELVVYDSAGTSVAVKFVPRAF